MVLLAFLKFTKRKGYFIKARRPKMAGRNYLTSEEVQTYQKHLKDLSLIAQIAPLDTEVPDDGFVHTEKELKRRLEVQQHLKKVNHLKISAALSYLASSLSEKTSPDYWEALQGEISDVLTKDKGATEEQFQLIFEIHSMLVLAEFIGNKAAAPKDEAKLKEQKQWCQAIAKKNRHKGDKALEVVSMSDYFHQHLEEDLTRTSWVQRFNEIKHLFTKFKDYQLDKESLLMIAENVFNALPLEWTEEAQLQTAEFKASLEEIRKAIEPAHDKGVFNLYQRHQERRPAKDKSETSAALSAKFAI